MTLNLMIINQHGVWFSADLRITDPKTGRIVDDYSVKQVGLHCADGAAMLAYAGIGWVNGVTISDWIRKILRGEPRTLDQTLVYLRDQATTDLGAIVKGRYRHIFTVGAFLKGYPWAIQIRNFVSPGSPLLGNFGTAAERIAVGGRFIPVGISGAVRFADLDHLARIAHVKPRDPNQFRKLLAAVNRRAAASSAGSRYVSPHCLTSYLAAAGAPSEYEYHDTRGVQTPIVMPFLLQGIDLTEMQLGIKRIVNRDFEAACKEAIRPFNPLHRNP